MKLKPNSEQDLRLGWMGVALQEQSWLVGGRWSAAGVPQRLWLKEQTGEFIAKVRAQQEGNVCSQEHEVDKRSWSRQENSKNTSKGNPNHRSATVSLTERE